MILYIIIILFFINVFLNKLEHLNELTYDTTALSSYNKLINQLNNNILSKYIISKDKIKYDDCFEKCNAQKCVQMIEKNKQYNKCFKCHKNPNKCYRKSIIGGNCDDCLEGEKQIKCNDINNFGCYNYNNIYDNNGVKPYYVEAKYNNPNSPYDSQCIFCFDIPDYV